MFPGSQFTKVCAADDTNIIRQSPVRLAVSKRVGRSSSVSRKWPRWFTCATHCIQWPYYNMQSVKGETGTHITIMSQFIPLAIPNHTGLYKYRCAYMDEKQLVVQLSCWLAYTLYFLFSGYSHLQFRTIWGQQKLLLERVSSIVFGLTDYRAPKEWYQYTHL